MNAEQYADAGRQDSGKAEESPSQGTWHEYPKTGGEDAEEQPSLNARVGAAKDEWRRGKSGDCREGQALKTASERAKGGTEATYGLDPGLRV